ncbi:hypothetical protein pEaSNUABM29_00213 [Erwinia phage pEa_SNUABM_29]|nr:hypothetical protein pEaSNUABM29_00213 [Erwinia phage pEa_SNUABM_29]
MLFKWLSTLLRRSAVKGRRRSLEAEFHKNTHNTFTRVMAGLELITEPLEYNGTEYRPITLRGQMELQVRNFDTLVERLKFLIDEYNRVTSSARPNQQWLEFPDHLKRKGEGISPRWLDQYFGTSDPEVARDKMLYVFALLDTYRNAFTERQTNDQDVLTNQAAHILRELETIVEHYL